MQTSYDYEPVRGFPGMKYGIAPDSIITRMISGIIAFGRGVMRFTGSSDEKVRLPVENNVVITDDAGTYTAGDIVATVVFTDQNGVETSVEFTESFDTDKDTTMAALAASIQAHALVSSATYVAGSHTITVVGIDVDVAITVDVSGITGTMTISSIVVTSADTAAYFEGITIHDQAREQSSSGAVTLTDTEAGSIGTKVVVYVLPEETVTINDSVYLRTCDDGVKLRGMFGKSSVSGKTVQITNARWRVGGSTTEVAALEISLP